MRQLTDSERDYLIAYWFTEPLHNSIAIPERFKEGFTAGLDAAAEQLAAPTAKIAAQEDALGSCREAFEGLEAERDEMARRGHELRAALKPFADAAEVWQSEDSQRVLVYSRKGVRGLPDLLITVGDLLAAQRALEGS